MIKLDKAKAYDLRDLNDEQLDKIRKECIKQGAVELFENSKDFKELAKDVTIIHLEKQLEFIDEMENEINGDCGIYMTNYFDMKRKEIDKLIELVRNYEK